MAARAGLGIQGSGTPDVGPSACRPAAPVLSAEHEWRSVRIGLAIGALPLCLCLTGLGWVAAGIGMHGPPFFDHLWRALIPTAIVVPHLTGRHVGDDGGSFVLFLGLQYAYSYLVLAVAARLRSGTRA